ncbi:MAG TPA: c-type cytochrome [Gemmatimonadales bacterium]|nr:c-type cytochrome [Gemmatimonadales bacterium]
MNRLSRSLAATALAAAALTGCSFSSRAPAPPAKAAVLADPPADHPLRAEILRGRAILEATRDSLPAQVGNDLRCTSCHLDGGNTEVLGWVGVYGKFPQYRSRGDAIQTLEDRVNDCLERSMNGRRMPADTAPMKAILAYFAWISKDRPVSGALAGGGITAPFDGLVPDSARGAGLYAGNCLRCHGPAGEGIAGSGTPLWGPRSFNIGAGMARYRTAAAFIHANMPRDLPGTLSRQDALDLAAFIDSRPRPDFAGKSKDWPRGGAPADTPYRTDGPGQHTP